MMHDGSFCRSTIVAEKDASVVKVTAQQSPEQQQRNLAGDGTYMLVMATPGAIVRKTAERGGKAFSWQR